MSSYKDTYRRFLLPKYDHMLDQFWWTAILTSQSCGVSSRNHAVGPVSTNRDPDSQNRTSSAEVRPSLSVKYVALTYTIFVCETLLLEKKYNQIKWN